MGTASTAPVSTPSGPCFRGDTLHMLGRGAMGVVYRAVHRETNYPVAVKALSLVPLDLGLPPNESKMVAAAATAPHVMEVFRREVRAVAGLDHPHIVAIFDHGEIQAADIDSPAYPLVVGQPYLVMELADLGSLKAARDVTNYQQLRAVLLALLGALSYAHARGVLHGDIKPSNILMCGEKHRRPGLKLADFGVARRLQPDEMAHTTCSIAGTPSYMAPEQIQGQGRDFGPWTDLYSVGCLAFELACGHVPFVASSIAELAIAHVTAEVPPLQSRFPVPQGFEGWVQTLLAKNPADRFAFAADAICALTELGEPVGLSFAAVDEGASTNPNEQSEPTTEVGSCTLFGTNTSIPDGLDVVDGRTDGNERPTVVQQPKIVPFPNTWRTPKSESWQIEQEVGQRLVLMRPSPLLGRDAELDALWQQLQTTWQRKTATVTVIRGPQGIGKSRLVQCLRERAHELGAAHVWKAVHDQRSSRALGLTEMLTRHLGCVGLSLPRVQRRLEKVARHMDWPVSSVVPLVAQLIAATSAPMEQLRSSNERYWATYTVLRSVCRERPLIVWADDVQFAPDTLDFVQFVVNAQADCAAPIMFVLTAQDESLAEHPETLTKLETVARLGSTMVLGPLSRDDQLRLLVASYRMNRELAEHVIARTNGNPLFAHQLLSDWIDRGIWERDELGFGVLTGHELRLPQTLRQLWSERVERLLGSQPDPVNQALDIAAALGMEVDGSEWTEACRLASANPSPDLVELLQRHRLVTPSEVGFSFVHGMLREAIQQDAMAAGRWVPANRACAEMLGRRKRGSSAVYGARLGNHRLEAGEVLAAIEPLIASAEALLVTEGVTAAFQLAALAEKQLLAIDPVQQHSEWILLWTTKAILLWESGDKESALDLAARATRVAQQGHSVPLLAKSNLTLGRLMVRSGQRENALAYITQALDQYRQLDEKGQVAVCLRLLGVAGEFADAVRIHQQAIDMALEAGDLEGAAYGQWGLAVVHILMGDLATAEALLLTALSTLERSGGVDGQANVLNSLGDVFRRMGDVDRAEQYYEKSAALFASLGLKVRGVPPELNLALLRLLVRRDFAAAQRGIDKVLARICPATKPARPQVGSGDVVAPDAGVLDGRPAGATAAQGHAPAAETQGGADHHPLAVYAHWAAAATAAARRDFAAWDHHVAAAQDLGSDVGAGDDEIARIVMFAGDLAKSAGEFERAERVLRYFGGDM